MGYDLDQSVVQRAQQRLKHRAQVQSDTCYNGRTLCSGDVGTGELFRLITMEQKHTSVMPSHFYVFSHVTIRVSKTQGFLLKLPWLCDFGWISNDSRLTLQRQSRCLLAKDYTALPAEGFDLILAKLASSWISQSNPKASNFRFDLR